MPWYKRPFVLFVTFAVVLVVGFFWYLAGRSERLGENLQIDSPAVLGKVWGGAVLTTNYGDIEITFFSSKATSTIANFITLASRGFYDGTKFHRVIPGFMIQGGDPLTRGEDSSVYGSGGPGYTFKDEINNEKMVRGVVAMANRGPDTNGSQFFIITGAETPWLQGKHTVFAKVVRGMDVVQKISQVKTSGAPRDLPIQPVIVSKITLK